MPQPYDYTIQSESPFIGGIKGYQMAQRQRATALAIEQEKQAMAEAEQKRQRQQQYQQAQAELAQNPNATAQDYIKLQGMFPEKAQAIKEMNAQRGEAQLQGDLNVMQKVNTALAAGKNDVAIDYLNIYSTALKNSGREDQAQSIDNISEMAKEHPEAVKSELYQQLLANWGPEKFSKYFEQQQGLGAAGRTQKSEILPDGSVIQVLNNGEVVVKDPEGKMVSGKAAAQTILKAQNYGVKLAKDLNYNRETGKWEGQEDIRAQVEEDVTRRKTQAKGAEERAQTLIERGSLAAEGVAGLKRGISLLDEVKTGGPRAVALRVKQLFGIESADEGELSNQLSKAVLGQLRETFGAAFTEREGARLERIEASFTKSPAANKRLLEQALSIAERNARRAMKAAEERGDMETVEDIKSLLEFSLDPGEQPRQLPQVEQQQAIEVNPGEQTATNPKTGEKLVYRNGQWLNINTGLPVR